MNKEERRKKIIEKLFPKDLKPIVIDINPCKEALLLLKSIKAKKSIIKDFYNKDKITKEDLKLIEKIILGNSTVLSYGQRLRLAKIKSSFDN